MPTETKYLFSVTIGVLIIVAFVIQMKMSEFREESAEKDTKIFYLHRQNDSLFNALRK